MTKRSIVHVEIPAADRASAAKFYQEIFGWDMKDEPELSYTLFTTGNISGGFPNVDDTYKVDDVVVHLSSDDIEADLKKIEAAGGKAVGSVIDMGPNGSMAYFTDPTGNRLALYKA